MFLSFDTPKFFSSVCQPIAGECEASSSAFSVAYPLPKMGGEKADPEGGKEREKEKEKGEEGGGFQDSITASGMFMSQ
jgi:hypothetical protein